MAGIEVVDGSKLFIGGVMPNNPNTQLSDYVGQVWVEISHLTSIGMVAEEAGMTTQETISDQTTRYKKRGRSFPVMENAVIPDTSDPGQIAFRAAADDYCRTYAFKKESGTDCSTSSTVTITNASPAVVTWNNHGLVAGTSVVFSTTGALPTGLVAGTTYYVLPSGLTTNAFTVSLTPGGAAVNTSGAGSGTHTAVAQPIGETEMFVGFAMPGGRTGGEAGTAVTRQINIQPVCRASVV